MEIWINFIDVLIFNVKENCLLWFWLIKYIVYYFNLILWIYGVYYDECKVFFGIEM